ncbi:MAG: AAA family ATPase [Clostridiales bacterium]|nr:AAA family ATPase [Clostridiales bacterium]
MDIKEFKKEEEKLNHILIKYDEVMKYYKNRINSIFTTYANNQTMIENLTEIYLEKIRLMEKSLNKPYFARLDFKRDGESDIEELYIGKVGVIDEKNDNIIIDWRAPVSSMYYDSNIGDASYKAPEGICTGKLLLKRQYEIENKQLKSYQDVDTVSNDELLKPYLEASVDNRLKNIVSTIQHEQNRIIREPVNKNLIIQGVAGSGKTTVALHRIAYLVYNNRENIKPEQYLIIGPNKFFVNYISGVLPDLDVEDVKQLTYDELCSEILQENITLIDEDVKLLKSIKNEKELTYQKIKVSMQFKKALDKYIKEIKENTIPIYGVRINETEIISNEFIKQIYNSFEELDEYDNIKTRLMRTNLFFEKYIDENIEQYREYSEKELKKALKTYFNKLIPKIPKIYQNFLSNLDKYLEISEDIKEEVKINIINLKNKKFEFEDLSSLIYLKAKINGIDEYGKYKQIVIDEAQDYGEFTFFSLKFILKNAAFSIFGDLAQSIYQYRSIENWESVLNNTFRNQGDIQYLLKSYRTTTEIMDSANNITKYIKLNTAKPVIRHGKKVSFIKYKEKNEQISLIKRILEQYKTQNYKTIAIICKNEEEAQELYIKLEMNDIKNITLNDTEYNGGICIITSYLAKGLEFDGVIISNSGEEEYNSNKIIDMKLLYVAMTRPLHELTILYKNDITKPLLLN